MADEPVAFKGRDQGLNLAVNIGGEGSIGHGQKRQWGHKGSDGSVFCAPFYNEIEKHQGPGKEDQRLIEVGKGRMTDAQLIGLRPSENDGQGLGCEPQNR